MGSLVPGWDSPVFYPITGIEKNRSMTNEEIGAYWRASKRAENELRKSCESQFNVDSTVKESEENIQKSNSLPVASTEGLLEKPSETSLEKFMKENGWWALTNSAFLNDPPVIAEEGPIHNYVPQFHVANKAATDSHSHSGFSK